MDLICVNDKFPEDTLDFYRKYGITHPVEGKHYTIRDVINHSVGRKGILLNEIINPLVPIQTGLVSGNIEVTWNPERFSDLQGNTLNLKEINKIKEKV